MRPKNKRHKAIMERVNTLSPLSAEQERLMIRHAIPHFAKRYKDGTTYCLDCGKSFHTDKASKQIVCPHCKAKLELDTTRKRNFSVRDYAMRIDTCQGFQVLRMFAVKGTYRQGEKAEYCIDEAFQKWIDTKGNVTVVGRRRHFLCCYIDVWDFKSDMAIRTEHSAHSIIPAYILKRMSFIPELRRNGFDGDIYRLGISPSRLFPLLLSDPRFETMLKSNQIELLRHFAKSDYHLGKLWASVKIAIRHHYNIKDASMWCDLIEMIDYMGKDIRNPQLVCPTNLNAAHDYWLKLKQAKQEKERIKREQERILTEERRYIEDADKAKENDILYQQAKSRFFDIDISDDEITIRPLKSVQEFMDEGRLHHHCVFTNSYYSKDNALILHALVNGESVETIEISLDTMEIVQCRGKFNGTTDYHERILNLMKRNMFEVAKRMSA